MIGVMTAGYAIVFMDSLIHSLSFDMIIPAKQKLPRRWGSLGLVMWTGSFTCRQTYLLRQHR